MIKDAKECKWLLCTQQYVARTIMPNQRSTNQELELEFSSGARGWQLSATADWAGEEWGRKLTPMFTDPVIPEQRGGGQ
jgi:hypothetical protein